MDKTGGNKPVPLPPIFNQIWNKHPSVNEFGFIETRDTGDGSQNNQHRRN